MDRDLPEGVIDADPPGGWDGVGDAEANERSAAADLPTDDAQSAESRESAESPTEPAQPDDPIEGEDVRRGADPDLGVEAVRGEEP